MKKTPSLFKVLLVTGIALAVSHLNVSAQVVPLNPTAAIVTNSIDPAGYYLFVDSVNGGPNVDQTNFPSLGYVSVTQENIEYPETFATPLTVGSGMSAFTPSDSGVVYNTAGQASSDPMGMTIPGTGTPVDLITYKFSSGVPTALKVGLDSTYPDISYYTLVLEDSSGTPLYSGLLNPIQTANDNGQNATPRSDNEFYYADVNGITAGDFLVVEGTGTNQSGGSQVTLGAVTFDPILTPEPSTYALMFAGLGMLVLVARLRRHQA